MSTRPWGFRPRQETLGIVVAHKDMRAALVATHQEFQLGAVRYEPLPKGSVSLAIEKPAPELPPRRGHGTKALRVKTSDRNLISVARSISLDFAQESGRIGG
jgi:hypothetical protein